MRMIFSQAGYRNALAHYAPNPGGMLHIALDAASAHVRVVGKATAMGFSGQENVDIVRVMSRRRCA